MTDQRLDDFYEYVEEAYPDYMRDPRLKDIGVGIIEGMARDNVFRGADSEAHMYAEFMERAANEMNGIRMQDEAWRQQVLSELPYYEPADPLDKLANRRSKRQARIGAKFSGFLHFQETTITSISNDGHPDIYCPENSYCLFRCVEEYNRIKQGFTTTKAVNMQPINRVGISPYSAVKTKLLKRIKQHMEANKVPFELEIRYIQPSDSKPGHYTFPKANNHEKSTSAEYFIGLFATAVDEVYHAVLIRKSITSKLRPEHFKFPMKRALDLTSEWKPVDKAVPETRANVVIIYDIETYSHPLLLGKRVAKLQVPYSISWCFLYLDRDDEQVLNSSRMSRVYNITALKDDNAEQDMKLFDRFLDQIYNVGRRVFGGYDKDSEGKMVRTGPDGRYLPFKFQCYAHNGSKFDNIYVKNATKARLSNQVGSNSQLKSLKVEYVKFYEPESYKTRVDSNGYSRQVPVFPKYCAAEHSTKMTIQFKDTYPFVLAKLGRLHNQVPLTCRKKDFDIANKSKEWYFESDFRRNKLYVKHLCKSQSTMGDRLSNWLPNQSSDRLSINGHTMAKSIAYNAYKLEHKLKGRPEDWRDYLKYDVLSLAHVFEFNEKAYNSLGLSMTNACGLPGLAWQMIVKTSHIVQTDQLYYPVHPSMIELCRQATYGGRVICAKAYYMSDPDDPLSGLICGDANSLYPSAMLNSFPVGKPDIIKDSELSIKTLLAKYPHFIVDIEFTIPASDKYGNSQPFRFIPYRGEAGDGVCVDVRTDGKPEKRAEGSHAAANESLLYPGQGTYRGVYNDVDILEMLKEGYIVNKVYSGIRWTKSAPFMRDLVKSMYAIRKELVRQGNPTEYVYKILLNSMYGKFLETVKQTASFYDAPTNGNEPKHTGDYECRAGQYQHINQLDNYIVKKPTYIGSYILAYSRQIMNNYIRAIGINNVYYSDTDSIYTSRKAFNASGITISEELGGLKNDYGDGCYITEAVFLDQKKYLLRKHGIVKGKYEHGPLTPDEEIARRVDRDPSRANSRAVGYTKTETTTGARFLGIGETITGKIVKQVSTKLGEAIKTQDQYEHIKAWYVKMMHTAANQCDDTADGVSLAREFWDRSIDNVVIYDKEVRVGAYPLHRVAGAKPLTPEQEVAKAQGLPVCYEYYSKIQSGVSPSLSPSLTPALGVRRLAVQPEPLYTIVRAKKRELLSALPLAVDTWVHDKAAMREVTDTACWNDTTLTIRDLFTSYACDDNEKLYYVTRARVKLDDDCVPDFVRNSKPPVTESGEARKTLDPSDQRVRRWDIPLPAGHPEIDGTYGWPITRYIRSVDSNDKPKYFVEHAYAHFTGRFGRTIACPSKLETDDCGKPFVNPLDLHPVLFVDGPVSKQVRLHVPADSKDIYGELCKYEQLL
jgi:hypothetical protein